MDNLDGVRILVVDDEEPICDIFKALFESKGAMVKTATTVLAAVNALSNAKFDILLSDVRMPDGGFSRVAELVGKQELSKLKIYLCSGFSDLKEDALNGLVIEHIFPKPFDFQMMFKKIELDLRKNKFLKGDPILTNQRSAH